MYGRDELSLLVHEDEPDEWFYSVDLEKGHVKSNGKIIFARDSFFTTSLDYLGTKKIHCLKEEIWEILKRRYWRPFLWFYPNLEEISLEINGKTCIETEKVKNYYQEDEEFKVKAHFMSLIWSSLLTIVFLFIFGGLNLYFTYYPLADCAENNFFYSSLMLLVGLSISDCRIQYPAQRIIVSLFFVGLFFTIMGPILIIGRFLNVLKHKVTKIPIFCFGCVCKVKK